MVLDIALIVVVLVVLAMIICLTYPGGRAFLGAQLMRSRKFREVAGKKMVSELAADPELLEKAMGEQVGKTQARQVAKVLGNRSESEREELLGTLFEKAESGEQITLEDLARKRPRTAEEARARSKKKDAARAKRKAAKRQKRR